MYNINLCPPGTIIIFCMCLTKCQTRLKVGLTCSDKAWQKPRTRAFHSHSGRKAWVRVVSRVGYEASHARPVRSPVCVIHYIAGLLLLLVDPEIHRQVLHLGILSSYILPTCRAVKTEAMCSVVVRHSHASSVWCSHSNCPRTCWS